MCQWRDVFAISLSIPMLIPLARPFGLGRVVRGKPNEVASDVAALWGVGRHQYETRGVVAEKLISSLASSGGELRQSARVDLLEQVTAV